MRNWVDRPIELRTLLNPAFLSVLIAEAGAGYQTESDRPLPFALAFLVVPVVVHEPTREALPTIATSMFAWLDREPQARLRIPPLARQFVPLTREAIRFGANMGAFSFGPDGALISSELAKPAKGTQTADLKQGRKRAHFVGRWLARAGDTGTILASWGMTV
jgi:hypothetical protein